MRVLDGNVAFRVGNLVRIEDHLAVLENIVVLIVILAMILLRLEVYRSIIEQYRSIAAVFVPVRNRHELFLDHRCRLVRCKNQLDIVHLVRFIVRRLLIVHRCLRLDLLRNVHRHFTMSRPYLRLQFLDLVPRTFECSPQRNDSLVQGPDRVYFPVMEHGFPK